MPKIIDSQVVEDEFGERLSVLESLQRQTAQTATRFERSIASLAAGIEKMSDKISDAAKPQWSTLASWAGVIIVFLSLVGGSVISNLSSNQDRIEVAVLKNLENFNAYMVKTAETDGRQTEKISAIEKTLLLITEIHKRDMEIYRSEHESLQKENREAHATLRQEIRQEDIETNERLDNRIQREIKDNVIPIKERLEMLEKVIFNKMVK